MNFENILVPIYFSENDEHLIKKTQLLQQKFNSNVVIAHIIDFAPVTYARPIITDKEAMARLSEITDERQIHGFEKLVVRGRTVPCVAGIVEKHNIDTVVSSKENYPLVQDAPCDVVLINH